MNAQTQENNNTNGRGFVVRISCFSQLHGVAFVKSDEVLAME